MDAYYDTYTSPEPVDEFRRDMNVKASIPSLESCSVRRAVSPKMCEKWQLCLPACKGRSGARVGRYPVALLDTHKLIRYQRNGIARLSRAVRQARLKK